MIDFDIQRCTRRCAATDRELKPGDVYYSVLKQQGAEVLRGDYSADAWQGPPEDAFCWWKAVIPDPQSIRPSWAPSDIMLDYFESLLADPTREDSAYVLALLLIRRKLVRLDETTTDSDGTGRLKLVGIKREAHYSVRVVEPTPQRFAAIQSELDALLEQPGGEESA